MKKFLVMAFAMMAMTAGAQKFAHFNSADVIPNMKEYTTAQQELETMGKQYEQDLKLMQDELQKKSDEYQKEQANLLENVRQRREQELQDLYQRLQQSYQDNQQALAKEQQEKMNAITAKVLDAIKAVGQAGGYIYIMDTTGGIPYISTTLSTDVTVDVKKKLGI